MTVVFDKSATLTGTDDGDAESQFNYRVVIAASQLSAASGNQCQLELRFGTASSINANAISSCWFGQSGASAPNFTGDQVQVFFGGNPNIGSGPAAVRTSDIFTLAQAFDNTKSYTCAFFVGANSVSLAFAASVTGVTTWSDFAANLADQSSQTTPANMSLVGTNDEFFLEKITITASASTTVVGAAGDFGNAATITYVWEQITY